MSFRDYWYGSLLAPALLASLASLAAACHDYGESNMNGSGSDSETTQAEFVAAYRDLACQNLAQCCKAANLGYDASLCASIIGNAGQGSSGSAFNPANADRCLADMQKAPDCANLNQVPSCNLVYNGMQQPGASCTSSLDCATVSGGVVGCDLLQGICVVGIRGQLNQACQQSCEQGSNGLVACVWGPASSPNPNGSVVNCFANDDLACGNGGQCVVLAVAGAACVDNSSCNRELYCAYGTAGYTCQARRAVGQSCDDYQAPCVATAYCSAGTCATKKSNGQRCLASSECRGVCYCGIGADCMTNGVCADPNAISGNFTAAVITTSFCGGATSSP
jgi:hypothetical protein